MATNEAAFNKLKTMDLQNYSDNLQSFYYSHSDKVMDVFNPMRNITAAVPFHTQQFTFSDFDRGSKRFGGRAMATIDGSEASIYNPSIEFQFPDKDSGGTTINYSPLPALAMIRNIFVHHGGQKEVHRFTRKQLYQIFMYLNEFYLIY